MQKTFRLFVSSTFGDFKKERDVLHKRVFPRVDKFCNENGFSFQPIDLRWGVSAEAQLDQKTLEVCLEEVRACKHFPHPNFLIMAGDRYGYIPLPYMIEKTEFDKIKKILENDKEKILINYGEIKDEKGEILSQKISKNLTKLELLEEWYKLDENQIPASFILKPRADAYKEYINWEKDQEELRTILQYVANILFDDKENKEYVKYFTSATEAEVLEGILDYKDITPTQEKLIENKIVEDSKVDKEYVYGYIRTIRNPSGSYVDFSEDKKNKEFLKQKAIDFKINLSNTLDKDKNILTSFYDSIELYEENQLKEFEEFIYEKLINAIETQKNKSNKISKIEQEIIEQKKFRNDKQKGFIGRENTLSKIDDYVLNDRTNEPLVIYGISGMGKSSLIAKSIDNVSKLIPKNSLIYKFVGATQNSTTIKTLLISICDELVSKNIIERIDEYEYDEYKFFKQINEILSNIEKPIILFIDALDQFQSKDSLQWLPENLNENFKIVFSVLNDEKYKEDTHYYNILKNRVNSNNLIDISNESLESSKELLIEKLLLDLNRKIDKYQTKYLLDKWKETNYSPLYLKIAIEEVKHWKSGDETQKLESSVEGIIKEYIQNLTKIDHHEEILVNKVFGYIHASKDGLSEKELLEILSEDLEDESLMQNKIINKYHEPIKVKNSRRKNKEELVLPMSIWSRLHTQIKPFIIERNIDNQPLMKFFHRQFTSVVDDLIKDNKIQLHKKLAKYFESTNINNKCSFNIYNIRGFYELPYHYIKSDYKKLIDLISDFEFVTELFYYEKIDAFFIILYEIYLPEIELQDNFFIRQIEEIYSFYEENKEKMCKLKNANTQKSSILQLILAYAMMDGHDSIMYEYVQLFLKMKKLNLEFYVPYNIPYNNNRLGLINKSKYHDYDGVTKVFNLDDKILSFGDDGKVNVWTTKGFFRKELVSNVISIEKYQDEFYITTRDNYILKYDLKLNFENRLIFDSSLHISKIFTFKDEIYIMDNINECLVIVNFEKKAYKKIQVKDAFFDGENLSLIINQQIIIKNLLNEHIVFEKTVKKEIELFRINSIDKMLIFSIYNSKKVYILKNQKLLERELSSSSLELIKNIDNSYLFSYENNSLNELVKKTDYGLYTIIDDFQVILDSKHIIYFDGCFVTIDFNRVLVHDMNGELFHNEHGKELCFKAHVDEIEYLIKLNNRVLLTATLYGEIKLWKVDGTLIRKFNININDGISLIASVDKFKFIICDYDGTIGLYSIFTKNITADFDPFLYDKYKFLNQSNHEFFGQKIRMIAWNSHKISFFNDFNEVFWEYFSNYSFQDVVYNSKLKKIIAISKSDEITYLEVFLNSNKDSSINDTCNYIYKIGYVFEPIEIIVFKTNNFAMVQGENISIFDYSLKLIKEFKGGRFIQRYKNGIIYVKNNILYSAAHPKFELKQLAKIENIRKIFISDDIIVLTNENILITFKSKHLMVEDKLETVHKIHKIHLKQDLKDNIFNAFSKNIQYFDDGYTLADDILYKTKELKNKN